MTEVVQVSVIVESSGPDPQGFGVPLIAAYHTNFAERVRTYSKLSELVLDGFATTSATYKAAAALIGQATRPSSFKVGRRANAFTQSFDLTPTDTTEGLVYSVDINGQTATYTVQPADAVADIVDGLVTSIGALTGAFTPTDNTTHVTVNADSAGDLFGVGPMNRELEIKVQTTDPGIAADLTAIANEDDDWYGLLIDSQSQAEIEAAASWVDTHDTSKIFFADSPDFEILDSVVTTDVLSVLQGFDYDRTAASYHAVTDEYLSAAWMGKLLPEVPGSITWHMTELTGIRPNPLRTNDISSIEGKNGNYFHSDKGVDVTKRGMMASGGFIDTTRSIDWIKARLGEDIFTVKLNAGKVPFTDPGIETITGAVRARLRNAIDIGILSADPEPTVTAPKAADVSAANKTSRTLPDVEFTATLAGAIHQTIIEGVLTP